MPNNVYLWLDGQVKVDGNLIDSVFEIMVDEEEKTFEFSLLQFDKTGKLTGKVASNIMTEAYNKGWALLEFALIQNGKLTGDIPPFIGTDIQLSFDNHSNPYNYSSRMIINGKIATGDKTYINRNEYVEVL